MMRSSPFSVAGKKPLLPMMPSTYTSSPPSSSISIPLARVGGPEDDAEMGEYSKLNPSQTPTVKQGTGCMSFIVALGGLGFILALVLAGVVTWRLFGVQDDLSNINTRLITAEALLVNHTTRLGSLNTTLLATTARSLLNQINIAMVNDTVNIHEARITSLENRTTLLEFRLTEDEVKLLGVMNNVTALQADMIAAQQNIITLNAEVLFLMQNASDHETRINDLELANVQNVLNIQNLYTWLQSNLTYIDARLGALNTTYAVTASGTAYLESGPAAHVPVTWQTRRVRATGGFDIEYLWISDSAWTPIQIFLGPSNSTYSFRVNGFASDTPVNALPSISDPLARPLSAFQRSKFSFILNSVYNAQVTSSKWNNQDLTLEFVSNALILDAIIIVEPLTFVIGFL